MREKFFLIVGIVVVAGSFYLFLQRPAPAKYQDSQSIKIGDSVIKVEVADTDAERMQGLSDRKSLEKGYGMLFIFDKPYQYGFWMKDMNFPIDIIWLDEEFKVISIERNVGPETFPKVFYPPIPIKYVVETNVGEL